MYMLGHYQYLCLVEEFQKPKDVLICITFCIKKKKSSSTTYGYNDNTLAYISVYLGHARRQA